MSTVVKRDMIYTPKGTNRPLHIYLPHGYDETDERYPVVYFLDGHNLYFDEDATYGKCWGLKTFLDQWDKPLIIVGIECGHDGYERLGEYSPYGAKSGMFKGLQPMGRETFDWIINDIKPIIDRDYRTYPFRECTAIAGSSMGGLMALYGLIKYNNWFSKGACVSSAIGFCSSRILKDMNETYINPDTRAYLSWGTYEAKGCKDPMTEDKNSYTYRNNKAVANKFLAKGAMPYMYCQIGGNHCEADWEKQIPIFMNFLWK